MKFDKIYTNLFPESKEEIEFWKNRSEQKIDYVVKSLFNGLSGGMERIEDMGYKVDSDMSLERLKNMVAEIWKDNVWDERGSMITLSLEKGEDKYNLYVWTERDKLEFLINEVGNTKNNVSRSEDIYDMLGIIQTGRNITNVIVELVEEINPID